MTMLSGERWRILSPYLDQALERPSSERGAWLAELRRERPSLAAEVEGLLVEHDALDSERFLEGAAVVVIGEAEPFARTKPQ